MAPEILRERVPRGVVCEGELDRLVVRQARTPRYVAARQAASAALISGSAFEAIDRLTLLECGVALRPAILDPEARAANAARVALQLRRRHRRRACGQTPARPRRRTVRIAPVTVARTVRARPTAPRGSRGDRRWRHPNEDANPVAASRFASAGARPVLAARAATTSGPRQSSTNCRIVLRQLQGDADVAFGDRVERRRPLGATPGQRQRRDGVRKPKVCHLLPTNASSHHRSTSLRP